MTSVEAPSKSLSGFINKPLPAEQIMSSFTDHELVYFIIFRRLAGILKSLTLVNFFIHRTATYLLWKPLMSVLLQTKCLKEIPQLPGYESRMGRILEWATQNGWQVKLFWMCYFVFGTPTEFIREYTAAWKQRCSSWSISIFLDNGRHQEVPCEENWSDEELMKQLISFYNVARSNGIPFEALGHRTVRRIDITSIHGGTAVGKRQAVLQLGAHCPEGRPILFFKKPKELSKDPGFQLNKTLRYYRVLVANGGDRNCLNFIRTYRASYISTAVVVPFLGSLLIGIIWTVIAVRKYNQDVQVSTQTAFTIASYVVTAGALFIALVAYLDSRYEASARDSQDAAENMPVGTTTPHNVPPAHPIIAPTLPRAATAPPAIGPTDQTPPTSQSQAAFRTSFQSLPAAQPPPGVPSTQSLTTPFAASSEAYHHNFSTV